MHNIFKDPSGKIVIAQKPNLPIKVWLLALLVSKLPLAQTVTDVFSLISFGAIFTWAWLEIFDGVNLWRRILGGLVIVFIILLRVWI